jgi:hypothetical protein
MRVFGSGGEMMMPRPPTLPWLGRVGTKIVVRRFRRACRDGKIVGNLGLAQKRFHKPVIIQPGRIDRDRVVETVAEAAEILLRDWPVPDSQHRLKAMKICLDVINGHKPPSKARDAFIVAAKDAQILLS